MKKIFLFALFFTSIATAQVRIFEIYPGGGNASAPYNDDYVVLYNASTVPINLAGLSIQYAPETSGTWAKYDLVGTIEPDKFFLIQFTTSGTVGLALPTPDQTFSDNLAVSGGKMALVNGTTALSGTNPSPTNIIDLIGWGNDATAFEETPAIKPSNNTQAMARNSSATDNNDNESDFTLVAPNPRGSGSAALPVIYKWLVAKSLETKNIVSWETTQETNAATFEVQHSANALEFYTIGSIQARGESFDGVQYQYEDHTPLNGLNYYRLKQIDLDGTFEYSKIVTADFGKNAQNLEVLGNPADAHGIKIFLRNLSLENLQLLDSRGQKIDFLATELRQNVLEIRPTPSLSSGIYFLHLKGFTQRVLVK